MAKLCKTLDIPQRQVLITIVGNPGGFRWHHRVLCHRGEGERWVTLKPDGHQELRDISAGEVVVLGRNAAYPADRVAADDFVCYDHDDVDGTAGGASLHDGDGRQCIIGPRRHLLPAQAGGSRARGRGAQDCGSVCRSFSSWPYFTVTCHVASVTCLLAPFLIGLDMVRKTWSRIKSRKVLTADDL